MNTQAQAATPREVNIIKRGQAIAEVRSLTDLCESQATKITELERELQIAHDRMGLLAEERGKWREDAEAYRTVLVELATDMSNIGLLTQRAQDTHQRVMELIQRDGKPKLHVTPVPEMERPIDDNA